MSYLKQIGTISVVLLKISYDSAKLEYKMIVKCFVNFCTELQFSTWFLVCFPKTSRVQSYKTLFSVTL